jgi:hypothetical protein
MSNEQHILSDAIHEGMRKIAHAIKPLDCVGNEDSAGMYVDSLTQAVMGMTSGLCRIADAINNLADAVKDGERMPPHAAETQKAADGFLITHVVGGLASDLTAKNFESTREDGGAA